MSHNNYGSRGGAYDSRGSGGGGGYNPDRDRGRSGYPGGHNPQGGRGGGGGDGGKSIVIRIGVSLGFMAIHLSHQ
jgi:hypothetical protein